MATAKIENILIPYYSHSHSSEVMNVLVVNPCNNATVSSKYWIHRGPL